MVLRFVQKLTRRPWLVALGVVVLVVTMGAAVRVRVRATAATALVVYNGRSHYGDEQVFEDFEKATGIDVQLRGGTAPELYERLRSEGEDTPADVLITTDLANLWRAKESGLLQPVSTPTLEAHVPPELRDRRRGVVGAQHAPAHPRRLDRTGSRGRGHELRRPRRPEVQGPHLPAHVEQRVQPVARRRHDRQAGRGRTEALLGRGWTTIRRSLNSDGELLAVMAAGDCDLGLANHYYLGRALAEDPDFPVAPAWPDQDGAGAHANVSGVGVVQWSDSTRRRDRASWST